MLVTGCWTGLLAAGLSLALVMGQNRYLGRPLLPGGQAVLLLAGGLTAGLVAGAIGQALYGLLARAELVPQVGFLAGWLLLGGLLGRGVGFFIPNLNAVRATLAGAGGGLLGALVFLGVSALGDVASRLMGAIILGFAIGLMVALVEVAFRKAWLEIVYGPHEVGTVNLGDAPISFGSDSRQCTILARNAAPVAFRYQLRGRKVMCENVPSGQMTNVAPGHRQTIGALEVIVRGATESEPAAPPAAMPSPLPRPAVPPPSPDRPYPAQPSPAPARSGYPDRPGTGLPPAATVKPVVPPAPATGGQKAPAGDGCPGCGRKVPGPPGKRYCMVCDRTF
jgi:hypothetical protein